MKNIEITQGEYGSTLDFTLTDNTGSAIDLSGSSIIIAVQGEDSATVVFSNPMTITDAVNGKCSYAVQSGDFDAPGYFYAEITVSYSGARVVKFGGIQIKVAPALPRV